jgi:hypothetical protein
MKPVLFPALLILVACGTPQEQCIAGNTRDARVVTQLIAQTEANIARGYALETVVELDMEFVDCTPLPTKKNPDPRRKMCLEDVPSEVERPVAIDLNAERAKLASLHQRQAEQMSQAGAIVTQCRALYPE